MKKTLVLLILFLSPSILNAVDSDTESRLISILANAKNKNKKIEIYLKLADLYKSNKDSKKAIEAYKSIIGLYPKKKISYEVLVLIGNTQLMEKQYADAIESYKEAIEIKPKREEGRLCLANVYKLSDLNDLAQMQYIEILNKNRRSFDANFGLANLYLEMDFNTKAILFYDKALKIKPDIEAFRQVAYCYEKAGDIDSAVLLLLRIEEKNRSYQDFIDLGRLYGLKNMKTESHKKYIQAINLNPEKAEAYIYLCISNLNDNDLDKALEFMSIAKNKYPKETSVHFLSSYIYYLKKDVKMAEEELRLAKEYCNDNVPEKEYLNKFKGYISGKK
ncbi:MAG: tetratricopeptide repeat protein [Elusimicrobia bacterium]|nr:tetratricopeptide repeat protein [Candidatus Liberimonas magnetica]